MNAGDVCLVEYPFTDTQGSKLRPVVIVSADAFNGGADVVVLPISGQPQAEDRFAVSIGLASPHFVESGLRFPSWVKCTKPLTLAKSQLKKRLGRLHPNLMKEVRTILAALFSITK